MEYNSPFDIEYDILKKLFDGIEIIHSMSDDDKRDFLVALGSIKSAIDNKKCEPAVIEVEKEVVKPIRQEVVVKEQVIKEVDRPVVVKEQVIKEVSKPVVVKEPVVKVIEKQVVVKEPVIKEVEKKIIKVVEKPVEKIKYVDKVIEKTIYKDRETIKYVDCRSGRVKDTEVIIHDKFPPVPKEVTHDVNIGHFKEQSLCLNEGITISSAIALPAWAHGKRSIDFKSMTNNDFKACVDWMVEFSKHNNSCCGHINGGNRFKIYKLASIRV